MNGTFNLPPGLSENMWSVSEDRGLPNQSLTSDNPQRKAPPTPPENSSSATVSSDHQ